MSVKKVVKTTGKATYSVVRNLSLARQYGEAHLRNLAGRGLIAGVGALNKNPVIKKVVTKAFKTAKRTEAQKRALKKAQEASAAKRRK